LTLDIADIVERIKDVGERAMNEEELKIGVEKILGDVSTEFALKPAFYEFTILDGRADALYGHVIIEYEPPGALASKPKMEHSCQQLKDYIRGHSKEKEDYSKYLGVAIDGKQIAFVRYVVRENDWDIKGPFELNIETVGRFIEALRGLRKKALDVDQILNDLGAGKLVSKRMVKVLYGLDVKTSKSQVLFSDWKRVFHQVASYDAKKAEGLELLYEIQDRKIDYEKLLFAIHTYYALIMKVIAAEVVVLYGGGKFVRSYFGELEDAIARGMLKQKLLEIEEGIVFRDRIDLTNFIEADYFSWYLGEWNTDLAAAIKGVIETLADYEIGTADLQPEKVKDLFKHLYQDLLPKKIRHDMGEYYTPDWLAEVVLQRVGLDPDEWNSERKTDSGSMLDSRILDPACGSGTFLVISIKRLKDYAESHSLKRKNVIKSILNNVVGFDLNPLAVIAARTNYLLALGDLLRSAEDKIEIPVYLADSIMVQAKVTLTGRSYILRTVVGHFEVPARIVDEGRLPVLLTFIENHVKLDYSVNEFGIMLKKEMSDLDEGELWQVAQLYSLFVKTEKEGKNRVWTGIIKNSFSPLHSGRFDFIVGNPPWVHWESLPDDYREASGDIWMKYKLQAKATSDRFELGKMGRDISFLFTYVCADRYLKPNAKLAFLITWSAFKSRAAEVFRRFRLPENKPLKVLEVHDLVKLKPFEGAANQTSFIILQKDKETTYPISYFRWDDEKTYHKLRAEPSDKRLITSPWITAVPEILEISQKVRGRSDYTAYLGCSTKANGAFWVKITERRGTNVVVENLFDEGKLEIPRIREEVEKDLLRPLVRGKTLQKWNAKISNYIVLAHTEKTTWRAIEETEMRTKHPLTYRYFHNFRDILLNRSLYVQMRQGHPFYIITNTPKAIFDAHKVVWKRMGNYFACAVVDQVDDLFLGNRIPIIHEDLVFVSTATDDEAYYLCGLLNSSIITSVLLSSTQVGGKALAPPSIIQSLNLPTFDRSFDLHREIARVSRKAHTAAQNADSKSVADIEKDLDELVAHMYDIPTRQLPAIRVVADQLNAQ